MAKKAAAIADPKLFDVIRRPVVTEKSTLAGEHNKVTFMISPSADKVQVKNAVESIFGVEVAKVNTIKLPGKTKKFRGRAGQRSDRRKAVVTLKAGQMIDLEAGVK